MASSLPLGALICDRLLFPATFSAVRQVSQSFPQLAILMELACSSACWAAAGAARPEACTDPVGCLSPADVFQYFFKKPVWFDSTGWHGSIGPFAIALTGCVDCGLHAWLFSQRETLAAQNRESRPLLLLTAAAGARGAGRRESTRTRPAQLNHYSAQLSCLTLHCEVIRSCR